ncbi:unnamed protein product [Thelazia callipaeda]|uniref:Uncharacterized protein n=1 Tax=Thelazia callipaeda TaxID=103827 RepID=A0A0N5CJV9_THECL|nr:unnamed protein product [Thelazia callipaeda]
MRGYGISVLPLTAGCRKDIENLLKMYKEKKTLRYEPFIDLFERSKFFTIFTGRMSPADLFEVCFHFERLFGIYLTYTLYFVQPDSYVAQVRITPNQMTDLICFLNERLIPEYHVDAFVALFKLVNGGAFRLYAFEKEHNPLLHRSFDLLEQDCSDSDETEMEEYSILKGLRDDVILAQANIICNRFAFYIVFYSRIFFYVVWNRMLFIKKVSMINQFNA